MQPSYNEHHRMCFLDLCLGSTNNTLKEKPLDSSVVIGRFKTSLKTGVFKIRKTLIYYVR